MTLDGFVGLAEAIAGRPTPFYVLDLEQVERRARAFRVGVESAAAHVRCAFPFKANPMTAVAGRAVGVYGCAEVATFEELELATSAPISASEVLIGGIAKSTATLRGAAEIGATIKLDSEAELDRLRAADLPLDGDWSVLLRIALPEADGWSRFGIVPDDAIRLATSGEPWTRRLRGVHFHAGTALADPTPFVDATRWCAPALHAIAELAHVERACLDIGGGYPNVADDDVQATAARFLGAVVGAWAGEGGDPDATSFVCEPGRITVERAGVLVATVVERASRAARCAVVIDAGSTLAGGSWAPVRSGRAVVFWDADDGATNCDVYGNLCHEGDLVAEGARLEPSGRPTGTALVGDVGAYRLSAAAPWMQELPAVHELRDGELLDLRPAFPLGNFA